MLKERIETGLCTRAVEAIRSAISKGIENGYKITIATCGPMTNLALFIGVYPDLLTNVERIVFMGGGVGLGNRSATSGESFVSLW